MLRLGMILLMANTGLFVWLGTQNGHLAFATVLGLISLRLLVDDVVDGLRPRLVPDLEHDSQEEHQ